ncbi:MAG: glycosyltransferase [Planctomycetota bacterium]
MPRVSVVIPTKDAGPEFARVLEAVVTQRLLPPPELVVIDSSSTDGTPDVARRFGVTLVSIDPRTFNHGATRNQAAKLAGGELIAFLTQDARPQDEHWLAHLIEPFADARVAGSYSRVVPRPDASPLVERSVKADLVYSPTPFVKRFDRDAWQALTPFERRVHGHFNNVSSCVRRAVFAQIPFPRIDFGEDLAWGVRMLEAGHALAYQPSSVVVHSHATRLLEDYRRHRADAVLMRRLFGFKNRPSVRSALMAFLGEVRKDLRYVVREKGLGSLPYAAASPVVRAFQIAGQCAGSRGERPPPPQWMNSL